MVLKRAQLLQKLGDDTESKEIMKYCINSAIFPVLDSMRFIMSSPFLAIRFPLLGACPDFQVKDECCSAMCE